MGQTMEDGQRIDDRVGGLGMVGSLATAALVVAVLWFSVDFLSDARGPDRLLAGFFDIIGHASGAEAVRQHGLTPVSRRLATAAVALVVGVGGVWALFTSANHVLDRALPPKLREQVRPWVFVVPGMSLVGLALVYPGLMTIWTSLTEDGGALANYRFAFTDPAMRIAFRNNVLWLVLGTGGAVGIGLAFAALVDRVKREAFAKTFVFLPMAISFVGASVIWRFMYEWQPEGATQIGLLNALVTSVGFEPVPWLQVIPVNTLALIVIMVWLQTGFAMVILSAALKGMPSEVVEAARVDGAGELQLFFRIVLPMIKGTILTVATAVFIQILKVFDVVFVMTGGRLETEVIANRMFTEMFRFRNFGQASALAVVLLLIVIPAMVVNVRNMRRQGIGS